MEGRTFEKIFLAFVDSSLELAKSAPSLKSACTSSEELGDLITDASIGIGDCFDSSANKECGDAKEGSAIADVNDVMEEMKVSPVSSQASTAISVTAPSSKSASEPSTVEINLADTIIPDLTVSEDGIATAEGNGGISVTTNPKQIGAGTAESAVGSPGAKVTSGESSSVKSSKQSVSLDMSNTVSSITAVSRTAPATGDSVKSAVPTGRARRGGRRGRVTLVGAADRSRTPDTNGSGNKRSVREEGYQSSGSDVSWESAKRSRNNSDANASESTEERPGSYRRSSRKRKALVVSYQDKEEEERLDDVEPVDSDAEWTPAQERSETPVEQLSALIVKNGPMLPTPGRRGRPPKYLSLGLVGAAQVTSRATVSNSTNATVSNSSNTTAQAGGISSNSFFRVKNGTTTDTLQTGNFILNLDDVKLDKPPIWRIDGKFLIQKYEAIDSAKNWRRLYKNVATYMSFSPESHCKFRPVSVRYHRMGRSETIVELMDNPHCSKFNLPKVLSLEETCKYLGDFEVYMQTLISQALDSNFLDEITQEGDEYFMKSMEVIKDANMKRREKILSLKSWNDQLQEQLNACPRLHVVVLRNVPHSPCSVCKQLANSQIVQLSGRPYEQLSLQSRAEPARAVEYSVCSFCAGLADLYSKVWHLNYHLYMVCCDKIAERRRQFPDEDSPAILNAILADETWLQKHFSETQNLWADVDHIFSAAKDSQETADPDAAAKPSNGIKS